MSDSEDVFEMDDLDDLACGDDEFEEPEELEEPVPQFEKVEAPKKSAGIIGLAAKTIGKNFEKIITDENYGSPDHYISAEIVNDNLFHWKVLLSGIEGDLSRDMKKYNISHIELEVLFPNEYPYEPPFVRVVSPRFAFHTAHVTIGGSICSEMLTYDGWKRVLQNSTFNSINVSHIFISIIADIQDGNGRLDPANPTGTYSTAEARKAFERVARDHNWTIPPSFFNLK